MQATQEKASAFSAEDFEASQPATGEDVKKFAIRLNSADHGELMAMLEFVCKIITKNPKFDLSAKKNLGKDKKGKIKDMPTMQVVIGVVVYVVKKIAKGFGYKS